ncbi:MAG: PAS domain S-box protein, partial [Candidatus Thiodiazotropha sp. 6PLUC7]
QDLDGNIQAWNPAAERLYGYTEQEALSLNVKQIVPNSGQADLAKLLQAIQEGKNIDPIELERVTKAGDILKIWLVASALLDEQGKPFAISTTERVMAN